MILADLFRSFRPLQNPLGFGAADFVVLCFAVLISMSIVLRAFILRFLPAINSKPLLAMAILGAASISLRLLLLPSSPVPTPSGADDFGYLLLADTLRHLRLANPTHPLSQFFEAVFILQQPTYSSIFPLGQGIVLALGHLLFGSYWAGVVLSAGALSALCYWMLRAWIAPSWAFLGGMLAVIQFGPLSPWTNSYWGGLVSGGAGCLVFGSLPRLLTPRVQPGTRESQVIPALLGLGLSLQLLTRPFEFILLTGCVALYAALHFRALRTLRIPSLVFACTPVLLAALLMSLHNKSVTGRWSTLPYMQSRYQYGVPTTFTFQPNPIPHRPLSPEQDLDYRAQAAIHETGPETLARFSSRLLFRLRYFRFFWPAPLYIALLCYLPSLRRSRWLWTVAAIAIFLLLTNFYPYFFPHYIAALSCVFVLLALNGLRNLSRLHFGEYRVGAQASALLICLTFAQFFFWYLIYFSGSGALRRATSFDTANFVNFGDPEGRIGVADQLNRVTGQQLVFVRYSAQHRFAEWISNAADIDTSKIVWARDLGPVENQSLLKYFPARHAWLLQPDAHPPKLLPYAAGNGFE